MVDSYNVGTKPLVSLSVGDCVAIQNRRGSHPLRWDNTGRVVERLEHRQYLIKCDGSGRVILRNRAHLRKISPFTANKNTYDADTPLHAPPHVDDRDGEGIGTTPLHVPGTLGNGLEIIEPIEVQHEMPPSEVQPTDVPPADPPLIEPIPTQTEYTPSESDDRVNEKGPSRLGPHAKSDDLDVDKNFVRRSTRPRNPPKFLTPVMHGKWHMEK